MDRSETSRIVPPSIRMDMPSARASERPSKTVTSSRIIVIQPGSSIQRQRPKAEAGSAPACRVAGASGDDDQGEPDLMGGWILTRSRTGGGARTGRIAPARARLNGDGRGVFHHFQREV